MAEQAQKIGLSTAVIIGMNAMIGAGIFTAPAAMASHVGPAGILAYLFVVGAVWFMAQSIARLSALYPEEGSFYVYAKQWGGHTVGLIASISYFCGLLIAMGLLSQVAGFYLQKFFPAMDPTTLGVIALASLVALNLFGVSLSQLGQRILIICTVFPLITITLMCFSKAKLANLTPFAPYGLENVIKATRIVIFGFFGFEAAASLFAIVKDPQKNVPRALTYSIILVGTLYTLFVASLIISTPLNLFSNPFTPLTTTMQYIFPDHQWLLTVISIAILSAVLGTVHSMIWSSSALLVTLVEIGVHKRISHSAAVLIVGGCIFLTFALLNNIDLFFNFTAVFLIIANILSMITLLTLKSEWESGQNIKTLLGMATASAILYFAIEGIVSHLL